MCANYEMREGFVSPTSLCAPAACLPRGPRTPGSRDARRKARRAQGPVRGGVRDILLLLLLLLRGRR